MMSFYKIVIVTLGLSVFLAWFIYTPLPPDMEQQLKVSVIDAGVRLYGQLVGLLTMIGVMVPFSPLDRRMADIFVLMSSTGRPWVQTSDPALRIRELRTNKNKIRLRMYEPKNTLHEEKRPVLVYFHGGGFSVLSVDSYDVFTRYIARESGVVVISVDYRLSPQYPYPTPFEDCLEAVLFVLNHAPNLHIDPSRVSVGGDSAGGNLAAAVSLAMKEQIKAQLLLVPALHLFTFNTTSVQENKQYFSKSVNNLMMVGFWTNYLNCSHTYALDIIKGTHSSPEIKRSAYAQKVNQNKWMDRSHINSGIEGDLAQQIEYGRTDMPVEFLEKMLNPYVSPLMADDTILTGLPRAYVMVAGYDIIRDDGIMYAARLQNAGIKVSLVNHRNSFHNALLFVEGPLDLHVARHTAQSIIEFLQVYV